MVNNVETIWNFDHPNAEEKQTPISDLQQHGAAKHSVFPRLAEVTVSCPK